MSSKILRRSGTAVTQYLQMVGFEPRQVFMAGIGGHHEEITVMREEWPQMELYGWEPNPGTFAHLRESFPGILFHEALWSSKGSLTMHCRKNWKDGTSVHQPVTDDWGSFEIQAGTLDGHNWVPDTYGRSALLWLDCEGSELEVLKGGPLFLAKRVGAINIEMTSRPRMGGWPLPLEVHEWLAERDFFQAWVHTIRPSIGQFDSVYLHRDYFNSALTCCLDSAGRWSKVSVLSNP